MSVSNLTNTKWRINEDYGTNEIYTKYITFLCIGNNTTYDAISMHYDDGDYILDYGSSSPYDVVAHYPNNWVNYNTYKDIYITGGTDATNSDLIDWLEENAVRLSDQDITQGTWLFGDSITYSAFFDSSMGSDSRTFLVNFSSNNTNYAQMVLDYAYQPEETDDETGDVITNESEIFNILYGNSSVYEQNTESAMDEWTDAQYDDDTGDIIPHSSPYQSVQFTGGDDIDNADFVDWLMANATQQSAPSVNYTMYAGTQKIEKIVFMENSTEREVVSTSCDVPKFNDYTWAEIKNLCVSNKISSMFAVGDEKTIVGVDGYTYTIRIVDLQEGRYEYVLDGTPTHAVFEIMQLCPTAYKINDEYAMTPYKNTDICKTTMPSLLNNFTELQSVVSDIYIKCQSEVNTTSVEDVQVKLFIASRGEIFPTINNDLWNNEKISPYNNTMYSSFTYYVNNDTNVARRKVNISNNTNSDYWTRSPYNSTTWTKVYLGGNDQSISPSAPNIYAPIYFAL